MKRVNIFIVLFFSVLYNTLAQSTNIKRYEDKFILAKDILDAVQKHDIQKIESIAQALTIPYSLYLKNISPLYKEDNNAVNFPTDKIHPLSLFISDSLLYNKYASSFNSNKLIEPILYDTNLDSTFSSNVYLIFNKVDIKYKTNFNSDYVAILFENKKYIKVINLEALITLENILFTLSQAEYHSYDKNNLPSNLLKKITEDASVYKLRNDVFNKYTNDTIFFNNVYFTDSKTKSISLKSDAGVIIPKSSNEGRNDVINTTQKTITDSEILERAEEMPTFPNGNNGLSKYLKENLKYPKLAVKKKLEGKVIVKFVVEKDGSIKNPIIIKDGVGEGCADEALRLVNKMPKWWPGKQNGKAVKVYYTLPITFSLTN